jgi:hypothetical protein
MVPSLLLNQGLSSSVQMPSFVRRQGGSRVVLPSIDALLSAREDGRVAQQERDTPFNLSTLRQVDRPQMHQNHAVHSLQSSSQVQQEQRDLDPLPPPHFSNQHSISHSHFQTEDDSAAFALISRQTLRALSSYHADNSLPVESFQHDASSALNAPPTASHNARHSPPAAAEARVPDGRFEFVGASIADGRRKQLARPSTAVSVFDYNLFPKWSRQITLRNSLLSIHPDLADGSMQSWRICLMQNTP